MRLTLLDFAPHFCCISDWLGSGESELHLGRSAFRRYFSAMEYAVLILKRAEEARESREITRMPATYERSSIHPGGEGLLVSNFLILFALIGVIRGPIPDLG
jgi:hypothetical protein